ncbi:maltose alpha-D-glucosyltransferase [Azoarcus olearius]|uniref:Maltokinase n=1 Tax=Azoarcus sp. (strain BH72) TaxID=418699 RepID=A1K689_AZOSB|nr:maltose alpha-D-glucosyltransferase [Azoarcus olearius]CAL94344.1 putative trehalose synthase [Azoarcus olearius]
MPLNPPPGDDGLWYKDAVLYELHVKAFFDGNDDGIGDFAGLTRKLDYIHDLGVDTLWLLPFYPSPLKDDGYDVADYHGVLPAYGTRNDFRVFVREAHRRGLRVITELVVNHTSDQHAWFQAARRAPPGSSKRNYYVWSDDPKRYAGTRIIFTDTETSNWAWDPVAQSYYWHRFFSHQPDLNYENPNVLKAVLRTMRFWLDMGVDGFRLDAVPYLREREGTSNENLPETHATIREIRRVIDENYRGRVLLAEANQWPEDVREYFGGNERGEGDECHMAYHFPLMPRLFMALAQEDRFPVVDIMRQTPEIPDNCQWAIFLRNHDELTLEMVTDRERDYMWEFFANDPRMRLNVGIRRRLAPLLENSRDRIELMSFLLLTMPGSPTLYYGDELGMGDNVYLGDRNGVRTPMQWTSDRNAGFSRADPQQLYLPPIMDPIYGYQTINVESQARNPHSLLNFNRRLIQMRKGYRAFGRGNLVFLEPGNRKVLAYLREYVDPVAGEQRVLCVANLARTPQAVELDLARHEGRVPVEISGRTAFPPIGRLPYLLTLPGHGFYAFELSAQAPAPQWHEERLPASDLPVLVLTEGWRTFVRSSDESNRVRRAISSRSRAQLQDEVLLPYLRQRRWFAAKGDSIVRVEVVEEQEWVAEGASWLLVLLEVVIADAMPQTYFLPLAIAWEEGGEHPGDRFGAAALARVREKARMGLLYDAFVDPQFCRALARAVGGGGAMAFGSGELRFVTTPAWQTLADAIQEDFRLPATEQTNTGVFFGQRLYLKGYRRLQAGINPELEMGYFLARAGFERIATVVGSAEFVTADGSASALAMMQAYVDSQGNAWDYTLDHLGRLFSADTWPGADGERDTDGMNRVYLLQMATLGRRVGELHLALADDRGDPAFRPEPVDGAEVENWRASVLRDIGHTLAQLAARAPALDAEAGALATRVLGMGEELAARVRDLDLDAHHLFKTRYHGDLHLGQVLVVQNDFVIVDFEGEPARPMAQRRDKHLALRDVAGMLRSLDYAVRSIELRIALAQPARDGALARALADWQRNATDAFVTAYHEVVPPPAAAADFLTLFVVEKLLYELRYELDNRPDWVRIPLAALAESGAAG